MAQMEKLSALLNHVPHPIWWFIAGIAVIIVGIGIDGWLASEQHEVTMGTVYILIFTLLLGLFVSIGGSNAQQGIWQNRVHDTITSKADVTYILIKRHHGARLLLYCRNDQQAITILKDASRKRRIEDAIGLKFDESSGHDGRNTLVKHGVIKLQTGDKLQQISANQADKMCEKMNE